MRIKLKIAYDGTEYCGWQVQENGVSIQKTVQYAIEDLYGHKTDLTGASRTDAGVHALCQIAVFDTDKDIDIKKIPMALNQRLPDDIRVVGAEHADPDFHPRYRPTEKTYEYRIFNGDHPDPVKRLYTHYVYKKLDIKAMEEGLSCILGKHDFICFCSANSNIRGSTERTIKSASINVEKEPLGDLIIIRITGDGFLHNMIRIIAGTLIKIGMGAWDPEYMEEIILSGDRRKAGPTAPASGLMLTDIKYL